MEIILSNSIVLYKSTIFSKSSCNIKAAFSAPIDVPAIAVILILSSFRAFHTPTSYAPFVPPPARTNPNSLSIVYLLIKLS